MSTVETPPLKKTCTSCRGVVDPEHDRCPLCGADISQVKPRPYSGRMTMFGGTPITFAKISPLEQSHAGGSTKYEAGESLEQIKHNEDDFTLDFSSFAAMPKEAAAPKKPWEVL